MATLRDALSGGITPPLVTPFSDSNVDVDAFDSLVEHVLDGGVNALFVAGTTGEAASLTGDEKRSLLTRAVDLAPSGVPVLVGGTGTSVGETQDWIAEASTIGADGVFLTAPYFHTSSQSGGYRRFFEDVLGYVQLPVILYNIPGFVGREIPPDVVASIAEHEAVIGMKDSSGDFGYGMTIKSCTPDDFLMLQGFDELLVPSLRMGFDGGVNAGSNVYPEDYRTLVENPGSDRALSIHDEQIRPLFALCQEHGFAPGMKAALVAREVLPREDVRPPHVSVDPEITTKLQ